MDADGFQDETLPSDHFHAKDSSLLSESAPSGTHPTVVPSLFSLRSPLVVRMAKFDCDRFRPNGSDNSSDESVRPLSRMSMRSASSVSLISSEMSDSSDYLSCLDESISELEQSFELPSDGSEPEESVLLLDDEYWPSIVEITYVLPSPSPPFLHSINRSIQIDEHASNWPHNGATLVIWDPNLCNSFQLASRMSILPVWWCSLECYSFFGEAAYMKLSESEPIGGGFEEGDPQSNNMEGQPIWNPLAPETPRNPQQRLHCVQLRRIAIIEEAAERI